MCLCERERQEKGTKRKRTSMNSIQAFKKGGGLDGGGGGLQVEKTFVAYLKGFFFT